jgi:hypothetical protein
MAYLLTDFKISLGSQLHLLVLNSEVAGDFSFL